MKLNYEQPTPSMSNTTNNSEDKASYITSNFTDNKDTIEYRVDFFYSRMFVIHSLLGWSLCVPIVGLRTKEKKVKDLFDVFKMPSVDI
jgi:hypothetical protein